MTNREVLERCRALILEINDIQRQLLRAMPTGAPSGVKAQQYKSEPGGTNDPHSACMQLCDGLEQRLETKRLEWEETRQHAWRIIKWAVDILTPRDMVILDHYYILGQTDEKIAGSQGLTRETVNRIRNALIEKI